MAKKEDKSDKKDEAEESTDSEEEVDKEATDSEEETEETETDSEEDEDEEASGKITLTADELQAKIDAAVAAKDSKTKKDRERERRRVKEAEAAKKGEYKELYESQVEKYEDLEEELEGLRSQLAEQKALGKLQAVAMTDHPEIADQVNEWAWPKVKMQLTSSMSEDEVGRVIRRVLKSCATSFKNVAKRANRTSGTPAGKVNGKLSTSSGIQTMYNRRKPDKEEVDEEAELARSASGF